MLDITGLESSTMRDFKLLLSATLDDRLPVNQLYICAFLLDPSQLKIDINPYLTHNGTTKELVLLNMIKSFKINHILKQVQQEMLYHHHLHLQIQFQQQHFHHLS